LSHPYKYGTLIGQYILHIILHINHLYGDFNAKILFFVWTIDNYLPNLFCIWWFQKLFYWIKFKRTLTEMHFYLDYINWLDGGKMLFCQCEFANVNRIIERTSIFGSYGALHSKIDWYIKYLPMSESNTKYLSTSNIYGPIRWMYGQNEGSI
jgi:hypothetical protein